YYGTPTIFQPPSLDPTHYIFESIPDAFAIALKLIAFETPYGAMYDGISQAAQNLTYLDFQSGLSPSTSWFNPINALDAGWKGLYTDINVQDILKNYYSYKLVSSHKWFTVDQRFYIKPM